DDDGKEKVYDERMKLPPDLANGLILTLLKNIKPETPETTVSYVVPTPKPRLVKLVFRPMPEEPFTTGGAAHTATRYLVKIDVPGIAGVIAPMLGKEPPDSHVWILQGQAPAFVKSESPMFLGGALWRIELISPAWPKEPAG